MTNENGLEPTKESLLEMVPWEDLTQEPVAPPLKREAWTDAETKPLRRVAKVAEQHNINLYMQCRECEGMVKFEEGAGGLRMVCDCTIREVI